MLVTIRRPKAQRGVHRVCICYVLVYSATKQKLYVVNLVRALRALNISSDYKKIDLVLIILRSTFD